VPAAGAVVVGVPADGAVVAGAGVELMHKV
jgi:hypothetical protein